MKKRSVKEGRCMGSGRSAGRRKASGTSAGEKQAERRQEKSKRSVGRRKAGGASAGESGQIVSREKQTNRQQGKAGETLPKRKRKTKEKRAERQPEKRRSIAPNTPRREQAAKAKKAAGCFLRLFCISGQRAERPAISRSVRYSRRRPASPAVWWRRPFHGRPPSAARPFRRRRSP